MSDLDFIYSAAAVEDFVRRIETSLRLGDFSRAVATTEECCRFLEAEQNSTAIGDLSIISMLEQSAIDPTNALRMANSIEESDLKAIYIRDLIALVPRQMRCVPNFGVTYQEDLQAAFSNVGLTWPVLEPADEPFFFVLDKELSLRLQLDGYLKFGDLPRARLHLELIPKGWEDVDIKSLIREYDKYGH